jgi:dienelactone hydrolase
MRAASIVIAFVLIPPAHAQPKKVAPKPGDVMIEKYLAAECDKLSAKVLDGAKTLAEWKEKRPRLVREYYDMLGLWPIPEKTPLKAVVTRSIESQGAKIECLHFQSKPGLYVTGNFFMPLKAAAKPRPTILYVCGHYNAGRDGGRTKVQEHGLWFANNGYNCLMIDTVELGEIRGEHHGTYGIRDQAKDGVAPTRMWWHSAGYTPAGVECWNGVRAIDYLVTRPEVDPERIGVTGISGGGAATFWIAAADERVKVAVPVSGMSDLESYVKNKVINGHCDCMFLYNTYQWDWTTIAALVAPRPMLFANSDNDAIFPMDANRRIIAKLRKLYAMYEKPELVDDYVSVGDHAYRPDLRVAVFRFLNKHLKGDTTSPVKDAEFETIPGKDLRVFPTDDDLPKDRINAKVDETFVPRGKVELPTKERFEEWKHDLTSRLTQQSLRSASSVAPAKLTFAKGIVNELQPQAHRRVGMFLIGTDDGILVLDDAPKQDEIGKQAVGIYPYALGALGWTRKSPPNFVERAHALLGSTTDELALSDILSATRYFAKEGAAKSPIQGKGRLGILAAYAALLTPEIDQVTLIVPPTSHKDGPHFLGILRILDIPEALGLLAPRPLTIIGDDPAFDRTAEIYRLAGAADKLKRVK